MGMARLRALGLGVAVAVLAGCGSSGGRKTTSTSTARTSTRTTTTSATAASQASGASTPAPTRDASLLALRPFSASSPWNTPVQTGNIDPNSARYLRLVTQRIGTVEIGARVVRQQTTTLPGRLFINTNRWAPPIVDVSGGTDTRFVCRQLPANCGDKVTSLQVPAAVSPLPQYDGWFTVTDRGRGVAYDFWRARRSHDGATISYQFTRRWDLNGPGFLRPAVVGARGSGLPLFAGVIVPQEIRAGEIDHALSIALPGPARRNYVQPASRTDGDGALTSLPEGARVRLRSDFNPGRLPAGANPRAAAAIVLALKRYGAIVVDRARVPTLYAQQNFDWSAPADGTTAGALSTAPVTTSTTTDATSATTPTTTDTPATTDTTGLGTTATDPTVTADASSPTGLGVSATASNSPSRLAPRRTARRAIPLLQGNELQGVTIGDFDVIQLPAALQDPPLDLIQVNDLLTG
ncbi:MAG: hypothetical protein QOF77_2156 [Solirubrobacteraceae bacterium]|nr:hypothetical protein [Solirubrobacteraceae bacterium]